MRITRKYIYLDDWTEVREWRVRIKDSQIQQKHLLLPSEWEYAPFSEGWRDQVGDWPELKQALRIAKITAYNRQNPKNLFERWKNKILDFL